MSLALLRPRVAANVRDGSGVLAQVVDADTGADGYTQALQAAVDRYSRARPRRVVADLPGMGSYDLALPATWAADWSTPVSVEYPAGERVPRMLTRAQWMVYATPAGPVLRFVEETPQVGETARIQFNGLHLIDDDSTTVPAGDLNAVVQLASGFACLQLAAHYANIGDDTLGADSVDHKSKAAEYRAMASSYRKEGEQLLPAAEMGTVKAGIREGRLPIPDDSLSHTFR